SLKGAQARWARLLRSLTPEDFQRTMMHPVSGSGTIEKYTALYAWHGKHHVAQTQALRKRSGW
ncbi:MAG: DinB family protein, partial [Bryobacterales bacterium]|nr:DinB family protein [Bryobacterales bacterium]